MLSDTARVINTIEYNRAALKYFLCFASEYIAGQLQIDNIEQPRSNHERLKILRESGWITLRTVAYINPFVKYSIRKTATASKMLDVKIIGSALSPAKILWALWLVRCTVHKANIMYNNVPQLSLGYIDQTHVRAAQPIKAISGSVGLIFLI